MRKIKSGTEPKVTDRRGVLMEHDLGGGYLYRPGQLLVTQLDLDALEDFLRDEGILSKQGVRVAGTESIFNVRLKKAASARVPKLVELLRSPQSPPGRPLRVSPNHVLLGTGHALAFPGGPPRPATVLGELEATTAGQGVKVAILDSGVVEDHPWLGSIAADEHETPTAGPLPTYLGHGTFIAGIVLQHAPQAELLSVKVFAGNGVVDEATLAGHLAALPPVHIVNLSLGTNSHGNLPLFAVEQALQGLSQRQPAPAVVAAAGNDDSDREVWPAAFDGVVGVAATGADGAQRACFSNHGPWVDAAAPGVDAHSCFFEGEWRARTFPELQPMCDLAPDAPGPRTGFAFWSGSSFAAPRVVGQIAATMSTDPLMTPAAAASAVVGSSDLPLDPEIGAILQPESFVGS